MDRELSSHPLAIRVLRLLNYQALLHTVWKPEWFSRQPHVFDAYLRLTNRLPAEASALVAEAGNVALAAVTIVSRVRTDGLLTELGLLAIEGVREELSHLVAIEVPRSSDSPRARKRGFVWITVMFCVLATASLVAWIVVWLFVASVLIGLGAITNHLAESIWFIGMAVAPLVGAFLAWAWWTDDAEQVVRRGAFSDRLSRLPASAAALAVIVEQNIQRRGRPTESASVDRFDRASAIVNSAIDEFGVRPELTAGNFSPHLRIALYADLLFSSMGRELHEGFPACKSIADPFLQLRREIAAATSSRSDVVTTQSELR